MGSLLLRLFCLFETQNSFANLLFSVPCELWAPGNISDNDAKESPQLTGMFHFSALCLDFFWKSSNTPSPTDHNRNVLLKKKKKLNV